MDTALEILSSYRRKAEVLKAKGSEYKEFKPLTIQEVLFIKVAIHPTARADSKELTRRLIKFLCDEGICTAKQIYDALGCADNPVLKRLKLFKDFGLVRRESKRFYIATDRLVELRNKYLDRVCD